MNESRHGWPHKLNNKLKEANRRTAESDQPVLWVSHFACIHLIYCQYVFIKAIHVLLYYYINQFAD